jgi:hypothetical protein
MVDLQRLTIHYIDNEDRIRLAGAAEAGATHVLWLTQRLLNRLVPSVVGWLEARDKERPRQLSIMSFEQEIARAALTPQAPVDAPPTAPGQLIVSVNIAAGPDAVRLVFLFNDLSEPAVFTLSSQALRQALGILYDEAKRAGWSLDVWPAWIRAQPELSLTKSQSWVN